MLYVEHELVFDRYLAINNSLVFDTVLTEDTGSGSALFSILGCEVFGCGGKDRVCEQCQKALQDGKSVLVVMDYNTVESYLLRLVQMQQEFKNRLSIITPTSSEYCVLASIGKMNVYNKMFDYISQMSDESLSKLLKSLSLKVMTIECIDLIIMSYLLNETNIAALKSYDYIKSLKIESAAVLSVVNSESDWIMGLRGVSGFTDSGKGAKVNDSNKVLSADDWSIDTDLFSS